MRAVLSLFLSALLWATGYVYAQNNTSYQIDEQATAQAPWKVGDIVAENTIDMSKKNIPPKIYRKFMGVTNQGYFVVQDFYQKNNKKATDPIALIQKDLVTDITQSDKATPFDGLLIRWYKTGEKGSEILYKHGKAHGFWTSWYRSGNKSAEGQYRDGKKQGCWIFWYDNGQLNLESQYQDGKPQGLWTYWYIDGGKMEEGQYRDGKQEGLWTKWGYEGKNRRETVYKDGKAISEKTFD